MQGASGSIRRTQEADATTARIRPDFPQQDQAAVVLARPMIAIVEQVLNGVQFGVMLFLMAAGLTLVFGIMNLINLAHGSLFMIGAFLAASITSATGQLGLAIVLAVLSTAAIGALLEWSLLRHYYQRSHLDQCLVTFGLILVFNEATRIIW